MAITTNTAITQNMQTAWNLKSKLYKNDLVFKEVLEEMKEMERN